MNIFSSSKLLMTQFRIALTSGHIFQFGPSRLVVMMAANHLCFINQISINLKSCRAAIVGVLRLPEICTPWLVGRQWGLDWGEECEVRAHTAGQPRPGEDWTQWTIHYFLYQGKVEIGLDHFVCPVLAPAPSHVPGKDNLQRTKFCLLLK